MTKATQEFIQKARKIHGNKYDYSRVDYVRSKSKVCIVCPKHGEFWQTPNDHLSGKGCRKCKYATVYNKLSEEEFIRKLDDKKLYEKYDYTHCNYTHMHKPITVKCKKHGVFYPQAQNFLLGHGCPKCRSELISNQRKHSQEQVIAKFIEVHKNKYDYSKVNYTNNTHKVTIICPIHGEFKQTPQAHLAGQGCPKCNSSKLELEIESMLLENNIVYYQFYKFPWLERQHLDFYLPQYNVAIECQGDQHFIPIEFFGGKLGLSKTQKRDLKKSNLCKEHGIKLFQYAHKQYTSDVITDPIKLLELITSNN